MHAEHAERVCGTVRQILKIEDVEEISFQNVLAELEQRRAEWKFEDADVTANF